MTAGRDLALWRRESLEAVESAPDLAALDAVRIALLGRKGSLTEALKGLAALSPMKSAPRAWLLTPCGMSLNRLCADASMIWPRPSWKGVCPPRRWM